MALYVRLLGTATQVALAGEVELGRGRGCALRIDDPRVSRRHLRIDASGRCEDLGGKNATLLIRGARVQRVSTPVQLVAGDVLKLGGGLVGIHAGGAAVTAMVATLEALEPRLAQAAAPLGVIRVQLASRVNADVAQATLFALANAARGAIASLLGAHELVLLAALDDEGLARELAELEAQLGELGAQGDFGCALYPRDGATAAALIAAAMADAETMRGGTAATPIAVPVRPPSRAELAARSVAQTAEAGAALATRSVAQAVEAGATLAARSVARTAEAAVPSVAQILEARARAEAEEITLVMRDDEPGFAPPLARFIGRAAELAQLAARDRLITIAGPPGAGKSRLAQEYARRAGAGPAARGVPSVALAGVRDAPGVIAAMTRALGCAADRVAGALAAHARVVLDDAEGCAPVLAELVPAWLAASAVQLIATSRRQLGVPGERVLELAGLPDDDAVALLRDRARTGDDPQLAVLARRLDGLPLALELAAGALDVRGLTELLARVPGNLDDLVDPALVRGERHHSLRGALDDAWAMLPAAAQAALIACAALPDGFSVDDAGVASELIAMLRRASWLRAHSAADGSRRFALLHTIRAYAASRAPTSVTARLVLADDARSLVLPSGDTVDLAKHAALRLIMRALAARRRDGIPTGLSTDELLAIGWPGERVDPFAGSARVRVALSRLRSLGLRDVIVRADDGYALAPGLAVELR